MKIDMYSIILSSDNFGKNLSNEVVDRFETLKNENPYLKGILDKTEFYFKKQSDLGEFLDKIKDYSFSVIKSNMFLNSIDKLTDYLLDLNHKLIKDEKDLDKKLDLESEKNLLLGFKEEVRYLRDYYFEDSKKDEKINPIYDLLSIYSDTFADLLNIAYSAINIQSKNKSRDSEKQF